MNTQQLIATKDLCRIYQVEISFFHELQESGILNLVKDQDDEFIDEEELEDAERMIRLHKDLALNTEGLEVIAHLLQRMKHLQSELIHLQNKLRFFEGER